MFLKSIRLANSLKRINLSFNRFYSKKIEKRNPKYSELNDRDLAYFEKVLSKTRCITDPQLLDSYNTDWLRIVKGKNYKEAFI